MFRISKLPTSSIFGEWVFSLAIIIAIAAVWIGLFKLNNLVFSSTGVSQYISWIFLPAAIRMLSVVLLDWLGAAGLFLGAVITSEPTIDHNLTEAFMLAGLSALGPILALNLCAQWLKIPVNLAGLGLKQLFLLSLVGALCNVIPHNVYFYFAGRMENTFDGLVPMFIGDLSGTAIVLYLAALTLKFCFPASKNS